MSELTAFERMKSIFNIDPFTLTNKEWHYILIQINDKWIETIGFGYKDDWILPEYNISKDGNKLKFGPKVDFLLGD